MGGPFIGVAGALAGFIGLWVSPGDKVHILSVRYGSR